MKTNLDKLFKTNPKSEKTGVWFDISDETGFLILPFRLTNPNVKSIMATYFKPYARQIELGTLDPEKEREISIKIFVHSCLKDWRGIEIDGKETPFSKEIAVKFLMELPELFTTLSEYASDFKNFKDEDEGDVTELGNSSSAILDGPSNGLNKKLAGTTRDLSRKGS
jgi:hypothetical protein